jgi:hypothetical protein
MLGTLTRPKIAAVLPRPHTPGGSRRGVSGTRGEHRLCRASLCANVVQLMESVPSGRFAAAQHWSSIFLDSSMLYVGFRPWIIAWRLGHPGTARFLRIPQVN